MPNFYNETYMKDGLHKGGTLARSNASLYGTKEDLYDRLRRHQYTGHKKGTMSALMDLGCIGPLDILTAQVFLNCDL